MFIDETIERASENDTPVLLAGILSLALVIHYSSDRPRHESILSPGAHKHATVLPRSVREREREKKRVHTRANRRVKLTPKQSHLRNDTLANVDAPRVLTEEGTTYFQPVELAFASLLRAKVQKKLFDIWSQ